MSDPFDVHAPIRFKPDDLPEPEGVVSALLEAQLLTLLGKLGGVRSVLLQALADPNRRSSTPESRAIRQALVLANEGVTIVQAISYSTTRRERL